MTRDQLKELKLDNAYWEDILRNCVDWSDVMGKVDYECGALLAGHIIGLMKKPPRWMHGPLILHGVELLDAQLSVISDYKNVVQGIKDRNRVLTHWATHQDWPYSFVAEAVFMGDYPPRVRSRIQASQALCWSTEHPNKMLNFTHDITWMQAVELPLPMGDEADRIQNECAAVLRKHIPDLTPYVATARLLK